MTSPFGRLVLIANPKAGIGNAQAQLEQIGRELDARGLEYRVALTTQRGDAGRLAREALQGGERFLVAVGGDGTIHEIVNGMVQDDQPVLPGAILGVIPAGSGCDFVKTFGLPEDTPRAVEHLDGGNTYTIDVGKITFIGDDGVETVRYFPNIAEAGLGGSVVERAERLPRRMGRSRYFFGFWFTLPGFKPVTVKVEAGPKSFEGRAHNVVVANGQYYGGGMRISPRSYPGDGFLDILVMKGPKSDAFTTIPKVYRGEHLPHKNMLEMKAKKVTVQTERPYRIEADGEVLGTTPATFEVISHPIAVKI
jgi:YegS/Rv2252/BmrU family lipid kinase